MVSRPKPNDKSRHNHDNLNRRHEDSNLSVNNPQQDKSVAVDNLSEDPKHAQYLMKRKKNNQSAKRCRDLKKAREMMLHKKSQLLHQQNIHLIQQLNDLYVQNQILINFIKSLQKTPNERCKFSDSQTTLSNIHQNALSPKNDINCINHMDTKHHSNTTRFHRNHNSTSSLTIHRNGITSPNSYDSYEDNVNDNFVSQSQSPELNIHRQLLYTDRYGSTINNTIPTNDDIPQQILPNCSRIINKKSSDYFDLKKHLATNQINQSQDLIDERYTPKKFNLDNMTNNLNYKSLPKNIYSYNETTNNHHNHDLTQLRSQNITDYNNLYKYQNMSCLHPFEHHYTFNEKNDFDAPQFL